MASFGKAARCPLLRLALAQNAPPAVVITGVAVAVAVAPAIDRFESIHKRPGGLCQTESPLLSTL